MTQKDLRGARATTVAEGGGRIGEGGRAAAPASLAELMMLAVQMERDAAARYAELADAMETHNNREVAELFRRMSVIELGHAQSILSEMRWSDAPGVGATSAPESPEAPPADALHYLMQPYHALELALEFEVRAARFFESLANAVDDPELRDAALALRREEQAHVELIRSWMARLERPHPGWSDDPDPPRYTD